MRPATCNAVPLLPCYNLLPGGGGVWSASCRPLTLTRACCLLGTRFPYVPSPHCVRHSRALAYQHHGSSRPHRYVVCWPSAGLPCVGAVGGAGCATCTGAGAARGVRAAACGLQGPCPPGRPGGSQHQGAGCAVPPYGSWRAVNGRRGTVVGQTVSTVPTVAC